MAVFRRFYRMAMTALFALLMTFATNNSYAASCSAVIAVSAGNFCSNTISYYCRSGCYCPGGKYNTTSSVSSIESQCANSTSYGSNLGGGAFRCPQGYPNSVGSSTANTSCYVTTTSGKYKASGTASLQSCTVGYYCPGNVTVYYNNTGGRTACAIGSYTNTAGKSSCTACQNGTTTTYGGSTSCGTTCSNASHVASWNAASWSANSVSNLCSIASCDTGYARTGSAGTSSSYVCTARTYTVSFNANGGSGGQSSSVIAVYDAAMPAISTTKPTKSGYAFGGWYDTSASSGGTRYYNRDGSSARTWNKTSNTTLYARWVPVYTVTLNKNGGSGGTSAMYAVSSSNAVNGNVSCGIYWDAAATDPAWGQNGFITKPSRVGYTFAGYNESSSNGGNRVISSSGYAEDLLDDIACDSTGNFTIYASWDANIYTCSAGQYLRASDATCQSCLAGYRCPSLSVPYTFNGNNQGLTACSGSTEYQDSTGQTTCKTVSDGYYKSSNSAQTQCPANYRSGSGASSQSNCKASCSAGYAVLTANAACSTIQNSTYQGKYTTAHIVNYGLMSTIYNCPTGYQSANGTTAQSNCQAACSDGQVVATIGAACSSPSGPWYMNAHSVYYGQVSPRDWCMNDYTNTGTSASNHDAKTDCAMTISANNVVTTTAMPARYIRLNSSGNTLTSGTAQGYTQVVEIQAFTGGSSGTEHLSGVTATSTGGSNLSNATDGSWARSSYTTTIANNPITWDMGATYNIDLIVFDMYTDGRVYHDVTISVSTDNTNWTTVFGPQDLATPNVTTAGGYNWLHLTGPVTSCSTGYGRSGSTSLGLGNTTAACSANTYTISYDLNSGSYGTYHPTSGTYNSSVNISNPTRTGWNFNGWSISGMENGITHYQSSNNSNWYSMGTGTSSGNSRYASQYFKNLRATSGTVTLTAHWGRSCTGGKYYSGSTHNCETCPSNYYCPGAYVNTYGGYDLDSDYGKNACPSGFTSPSGSYSAYQCTKSGTTTCATFNPVSISDAHSSGVQYATSGSLACTQHAEESYIDTGNVTVCMPNAGVEACDVVGLNCNTGYHSERVYTSLLDDADNGSNYTDFIEYEPNGEYEYGNSDYDRYDKFNGEWDTWFNYGVVRGRSRCSYDGGDYGDSDSDPSDDDGYNCWCKTVKFNSNGSNQSTWSLADSDWVYVYDFDGNESDCADECSYACAAGAVGYDSYDDYSGIRDDLYGDAKTYQCTANTYTVAYDLSDGGALSCGSRANETKTYDTVFNVSAPSNCGDWFFRQWKISGMDSTTHRYGYNNNVSYSTSSQTLTGNYSYFKNLRATPGTVNFVAQWGLSCDEGTYFDADNKTCETCPAGSYCPGGTGYSDSTTDVGIYACPSGFTSDVGTKFGTLCYKTGTTSCATANPITLPDNADHMNYATSGNNVPCKIYAEVDGCPGDDGEECSFTGDESYCIPAMGACDVTGVTCDAGYYETSLNSYLQDSYDNSNNTGYLEFEPNGTVEWSDWDDTLRYAKNNGEWDVWFDYGVVRGRSRCSTSTGTPGAAGTPSSTAGQYCWCQITGYNDNGENDDAFYQAISPWVASTNYNFGNYDGCSWECSYRCAVSSIGSNNSSVRTTAFSNASQYACDPDDFTVYLDKNANDAVVGTTQVSATFDSTMPVPITLPTRSGYSFDGYYDTSAASGGTKYYNADGSSAHVWDKPNSATLYARWATNTYNITLDYNNGSGGSTVIKEVYDVGWKNSSDATITSVSVPTKSDSVFVGYYSTNAASGGTQYISASGTPLPAATTFTANTTIYARYESCVCNTTNANHVTCTVTGAENNQCQYSYTCDTGYADSAYVGQIVTSGTFSGSTATASTTSPSCNTTIYYDITYMDNDETITTVYPTSYSIVSNVTLQPYSKANHVFGGWYDNPELTGSPVTGWSAGTTTGNKTFYAKWSQITCPAGYYVPAGGNACRSCSDQDHYCPGGTYTPGAIDQGKIQCPAVTNTKEGAYSVLSYSTSEFQFMGGDVNKSDSIEDCTAFLLYGTVVDMMSDDDPLQGYNSNLPVNTNNALYYPAACTYDTTEQAYTKCLPVFAWELMCKNGYYIPQADYDAVTSLIADADGSASWIARFKNMLGAPYACTPAARGYYTNTYDSIVENDKLNEGDSETIANNVGTTVIFLFGTGYYDFGTGQDELSLSDVYKQCPSEYPDSEPASWQKAHCFATVTYNSNGGSSVAAQNIYYDDSRSSGYTISTLPTPTRSGATFAGWYTNAEHTGNAVTTSTVFTGHQTLYAKWTVSCPAGQYALYNGTCTTCTADYYCPGGTWEYDGTAKGQENCPNISIHEQTSLPADYYNATRISTILTTPAGSEAVTDCTVKYVYTNSRGRFTVENVHYNTTTEKYDANGTRYYTKLNPGYYGSTKYSDTQCNTSSNYMLYQDALECPAGKYCPGYNSGNLDVISMPLCSSGTYETTMGAFDCAIGSYSTAGASACTPCQNGTTTSAAGQTSCNATCSNNANVSTWTTATWSSTETGPSSTNSVSDLCSIDTCATNYTRSGSTGAASSYICSANSYTISYTMNNGTNYNNAPTSYTYGVGATINGTPTRSGFVFGGWCTNEELTTCAATQTISTTDTGNKTFYAKWIKNLTYDPGNGESTTSDTCQADESFVLPTAPTRTNYTFAGWAVDK